MRTLLSLLLFALVGVGPATAQNLPPLEAFDAEARPASVVQERTPCTGGQAAGFPCQNVDLLGLLSIRDLGGTSTTDANDIWGWTDPQTGTDYALIGLSTGTSFVDLSDPTAPTLVGFLPSFTGSSLWRDVKVYADHAFIVSEASGHGMQVFDLTQLRGITTPQTLTETAHYDGFGNAHNVVINEETGFAYGVGTNTCAGGLHMVNIQSPTNPQGAGCFSQDGYTHDAQCVVYDGPDAQHQGREICVNSNEDTVTIVDVTDKSRPSILSRTSYPQSAYTHQGWLTEDQRYFYLDDELDESFFGGNTRTYIWDVTDLDDPMLVRTYTGSTTAIDHNQYIAGTHAYQSNYTAGLRILDVSSPTSPVEVAYFDTYPSSDGRSFLGSWSNYPFFESGIVIVSSIDEGLFVLEPNLEPVVPGDVTITVTPTDPPIEIAPTGGVFTYSIEVSNTGSAPSSVDVWVTIEGPGVSRTIGPRSVTLDGGATLQRTLTQNVPAGAPAGSYTLTGTQGTFPLADAADGFTFTKLSGAAAPASVNDWYSNFDDVMTATVDAPEVPSAARLHQNYPNPFNPQTTIRYETARQGPVRLAVYDLLGREVQVLLDGVRPAGAHEVTWTGLDAAGQPAPSGLYLYRLETDGQVLTRTLHLLK